MSDIPMGSGWWQASDGKWYPPEQHPYYQWEAASTAPTPQCSPAQPTTFGTLSAGKHKGHAGKEGRRRRGRVLAIVALAVVLLAGGGTGAYLVTRTMASLAPFVFPQGTGTGSITVMLGTGTTEPTFSGSIDGHALSGRVSGNAFGGNATSTNANASYGNSQSFSYTGNFDGTAYVLHIKLDTSALRNAIRKTETGHGAVRVSYPIKMTFDVSGSYGRESVTATAYWEFTYVSLSTTSESLTTHIQGRIGNQSIMGIATVRNGQPGRTMVVHATFAISDGSVGTTPTISYSRTNPAASTGGAESYAGLVVRARRNCTRCLGRTCTVVVPKAVRIAENHQRSSACRPVREEPVLSVVRLFVTSEQCHPVETADSSLVVAHVRRAGTEP